MYKEIYPNIYHLEVPLRNSPLKALNCYIIKGEESLLIDTGFDTQENKDLLKKTLEDLKIDPHKTRLFLTHLHSDHTGLAHYLEELGLEIFIGGVDGEFLKVMTDKYDSHWQKMLRLAQLQGLEEDRLELEDHPGFKFRPKKLPNLKYTKEGQLFQVAGYKLQVIDLPGHTPGLQGLYEANHGFLFSGDHLLEDISPNITFWGEKYGDSLGIYLENLEYLREMDIKQIFSSHRKLPIDHLKRIDELVYHHEERLKEILTILEKQGPSTVREVTKAMHWDIRARGWDDFPSSQKWFAAGEAHAHLVHLREKMKIKEEQREGLLYYSLI